MSYCYSIVVLTIIKLDYVFILYNENLAQPCLIRQILTNDSFFFVLFDKHISCKLERHHDNKVFPHCPYLIIISKRNSLQSYDRKDEYT
jgi:hypothetical protein